MSNEIRGNPIGSTAPPRADSLTSQAGARPTDAGDVAPAGAKKPAQGVAGVEDSRSIGRTLKIRAAAAKNRGEAQVELPPPSPPAVTLTPELLAGAESFAGNIAGVIDGLVFTAGGADTREPVELDPRRLAAVQEQIHRMSLGDPGGLRRQGAALQSSGASSGAAIRTLFNVRDGKAPNTSVAEALGVEPHQIRDFDGMSSSLVGVFLKLNLTDPNNSPETHVMLQEIATELRQLGIDEAIAKTEQGRALRKEAEAIEKELGVWSDVTLGFTYAMAAVAIVVATMVTFGAATAPAVYGVQALARAIQAVLNLIPSSIAGTFYTPAAPAAGGTAAAGVATVSVNVGTGVGSLTLGATEMATAAGLYGSLSATVSAGAAGAAGSAAVTAAGVSSAATSAATVGGTTASSATGAVAAAGGATSSAAGAGAESASALTGSAAQAAQHEAVVAAEVGQQVAQKAAVAPAESVQAGSATSAGAESGTQGLTAAGEAAPPKPMTPEEITQMNMRWHDAAVGFTYATLEIAVAEIQQRSALASADAQQALNSAARARQRADLEQQIIEEEQAIIHMLMESRNQVIAAVTKMMADQASTKSRFSSQLV